MDEKPPAISVIMPVYNTPVVYLKDAVESIFTQTFTDYEFIVVDDGSDREETITYLRQLEHPRLRKITHDKNRHLATAKNTGIEAARGKYIVTMDSDDLSYPHRLAEQHAFMESHPAVVFSGVRHKEFQDRHRRVWNPSSDAALRAHLPFRNPFPSGGSIYRREAICQHGLRYQDFYGEDYVFIYQCSKIGKVALLPKVLLLYRVHLHSLTGNLWLNLDEFLKKATPMYQSILEDFLGMPVDQRWVHAHILFCLVPVFPGRKELAEIFRWSARLMFHPKVTVRQRLVLLLMLVMMYPRALKRKLENKG
jgi:glycosyltransferase involved in cell wall biosynthesis